MNEVPCIVITDLSAEKIKAFRLVDNRTSELAEWDIEALRIELEDIDMDLSVFEFEIPEADPIIPDEDFEIELPDEPNTKPGEIWALGIHRLMCGDSTVAAAIDQLMDMDIADLILTDPPYNVNYEGTAGSMDNDNMDENAFHDFLLSAFTVCDYFLKPGGAFYIWHADSRGDVFRNTCKEAGWQVRQCLIWNKNSFVMGRQDYQWKHEPCLYDPRRREAQH